MSADAASLIERLAALERASGSAGSRRAAELVAEALRASGASVRLEEERVHVTCWVPVGLLAGAGLLAACLPRRARFGLAAAAAAAMADDLWVGRQLLRRLLPKRTAVNVVGELGDGPETIVVHAHHDAAHSGVLFHPAIPRTLAAAAPQIARRVNTTPPIFWSVIAGPILVAAGARRIGGLICGATLALMVDIARAPVVPGANDNLSGVAALVELAAAIADDPPAKRVVFLSTDSEESFLEGMRAFLARHAGSLDRSRTTFLCLESVGGSDLVALDGEGCLKLHRYPEAARRRLLDAALAAGVGVERGFRFRFATDGQLPLRAGYATAVLTSIDWYRTPRNYHWPSDDAQHVATATMHSAAVLAAAFLVT